MGDAGDAVEGVGEPNLGIDVVELGRGDEAEHEGGRWHPYFGRKVSELYCLAQELGTHFVVRTVVDRLAGDGSHTVMTEMNTTENAGTYVIAIRTDADEVEQVTLDIRYGSMSARLRYPGST